MSNLVGKSIYGNFEIIYEGTECSISYIDVKSEQVIIVCDGRRVNLTLEEFSINLNNKFSNQIIKNINKELRGNIKKWESYTEGKKLIIKLNDYLSKIIGFILINENSFLELLYTWINMKVDFLIEYDIKNITYVVNKYINSMKEYRDYSSIKESVRDYLVSGKYKEFLENKIEVNKALQLEKLEYKKYSLAEIIAVEDRGVCIKSKGGTKYYSEIELLQKIANTNTEIKEHFGTSGYYDGSNFITYFLKENQLLLNIACIRTNNIVNYKVSKNQVNKNLFMEYLFNYIKEKELVSNNARLNKIILELEYKVDKFNYRVYNKRIFNSKILINEIQQKLNEYYYEDEEFNDTRIIIIANYIEKRKPSYRHIYALDYYSLEIIKLVNESQGEYANNACINKMFDRYNNLEFGDEIKVTLKKVRNDRNSNVYLINEEKELKRDRTINWRDEFLTTEKRFAVETDMEKMYGEVQLEKERAYIINLTNAKLSKDKNGQVQIKYKLKSGDAIYLKIGRNTNVKFLVDKNIKANLLIIKYKTIKGIFGYEIVSILDMKKSIKDGKYIVKDNYDDKFTELLDELEKENSNNKLELGEEYYLNYEYEDYYHYEDEWYDDEYYEYEDSEIEYDMYLSLHDPADALDYHYYFDDDGIDGEYEDDMYYGGGSVSRDDYAMFIY